MKKSLFANTCVDDSLPSLANSSFMQKKLKMARKTLGPNPTKVNNLKPAHEPLGVPQHETEA